MKTVWERLSVELGHQPYPLTFILVEKVSAISRKARLSRHHQQHTKLPEDVPITNPTLLALQDAYRAVNWGLGPPTRAKEMRLDLRDQLQLKIDSDHIGVTLTKRGQDPIGGFVHLGGVATNFMLRETELALLEKTHIPPHHRRCSRYQHKSTRQRSH